MAHAPMCRLFGQVSLAPRTASDYLAEAPRSLLRQSRARPADLQQDGWGLAYFPAPGRARVRKSPLPVFDEAPRFVLAASRARSRVVIGHIRAASNPRGVAPKRLISLLNTQPFTDGRWAFCHNGTLQIPDEVAKLLGPYRSRVESLNDSEVYFWQLRKFIDAKGGDVAAALKACARETWGVWAACRSRYPKKKAPYTGLNALVSDGRGLYALSHYPSRPGHKAFFSGQPWGVMSLAKRGDRVLICSEDMDSGSWDRLGPGAVVVSAVPKGGRIAVRREVFDPREIS